MIEDDDDYRPAPVAPPQPVMIPVRQFTAYTGDGDPIEIVGAHLEDEEINWVGIATMEDGEIFPQIIRYSVFNNNG
jgi:hypothetical protein